MVVRVGASAVSGSPSGEPRRFFSKPRPTST